MNGVAVVDEKVDQERGGFKIEGQQEMSDVQWSQPHTWERLELAWLVNGCGIEGQGMDSRLM